MNRFCVLLTLLSVAAAEVTQSAPGLPGAGLQNSERGVPAPRKLDLQQNNANTGFYMQQLLQTHQVSNEAQLQTQRQDELRGFENAFGNMEMKIDEFRNGLSQKLMELKNSLQRPKVPILGLGNMMNHPYTGVYSSSSFSKVKDAANAAARSQSLSSNSAFQSLQNNFKNSIENVMDTAESLKSMASPNQAVQKGMATLAAHSGAQSPSQAATNTPTANTPTGNIQPHTERKLTGRSKATKRHSIM